MPPYTISLANLLNWRLNHFGAFARNGRWGSCADCPRDAKGLTYPEDCEHTTRSDHQLTLGELVASYQFRLDSCTGV